MVLKVGEELWHLHVYHNFLPDDSSLPRKKRKSWDVETRVCVHTGVCVWNQATEPRHCINGAIGSIFCSKKDPFCKSVGLKLALKDAMRTLPEPTRKAIWDALWLRMRRPKERPEKFRKRVGPTQKAA